MVVGFWFMVIDQISTKLTKNNQPKTKNQYK